MRMIAGGLVTLSGAVLCMAGTIAFSFKGQTEGEIPALILWIAGFAVGFIGLSMALYGERPKE